MIMSDSGEVNFALGRLAARKPMTRHFSAEFTPLAVARPQHQTLACLPTNSIIRPNISPLFDRSGDEPAWRSISM